MKKRSPLGQAILGFFANTSPLMNGVGQVALVVVLNVCWLVCCLPIFTIGASTSAMYMVLLHRQDLSFDGVPRAFFRAFLKTARAATLLWLLAVAVGGLVVLNWYLLTLQGFTRFPPILAILLLVSVVYAFTLLWLFPLLAAQNGGVIATLHRAFLLGLRELWRSFLLLALDGLILFLLFYAQTHAALWGAFLLVGFAGTAFLTTKLLERIIIPPTT